LNISLDSWLDISLDSWLLDNSLDLLGFLGLVNNLSGDCLIVNSLLYSFNWDVLNGGFIGGLRVIIGDVLNGVVVGNFGLNWDVFSVSDFLVFNDDFLVWDLLEMAVAFN